MGLLEKAQEKKQKLEDIDNEDIFQEKDEIQNIKSNIDKKLPNEIAEEKKLYKNEDLKGKKEIIEEKKGFGWKGLGARRITYYQDINDYVYEVFEPVLNESEKLIKKELSHYH